MSSAVGLGLSNNRMGGMTFSETAVESKEGDLGLNRRKLIPWQKGAFFKVQVTFGHGSGRHLPDFTGV